MTTTETTTINVQWLGQHLRDVLRTLATAADTGCCRWAIGGAMLQVRGGRVTATATDARRAVRIELGEGEGDGEAILSADFIRLAIEMLRCRPDAAWTLTAGDGLSVLHAGGAHLLQCPLAEGRFPRCDDLFDDREWSGEMDRKRLVKDLNSAGRSAFGNLEFADVDRFLSNGDDTPTPCLGLSCTGERSWYAAIQRRFWDDAIGAPCRGTSVAIATPAKPTGAVGIRTGHATWIVMPVADSDAD